MNQEIIWRYLIEGPWIVFVIYWAGGALKTRRTVSQESFASRYGILVLEILGFVLLFSDLFDFEILDRRVIERTYALAVIGVVLTWAGIGLALWARWHLGQYWSARITLKAGVPWLVFISLCYLVWRKVRSSKISDGALQDG